MCFYKLGQGIFVGKIEKGTIFYGLIRFGSVPLNIWIGSNCMIGKGVFFSTGKDGKIIIGNNSSINTGSHIVCLEEIKIGDNTSIGEYVTIRDQNHGYSDPKTLIKNQGYSVKKIIIGNDVWIGRGAFISPGVVIGDGCVVGANSVVTKSVEKYSVVAGIPARILKKRM